MPAIQWSNGHVDAAPSWDALLDKVRVTQWYTMDEAEFRTVLVKRAYRWSHTRIEPDLPAVQLFAGLERARMIEVIDRGTEED